MNRILPIVAVVAAIAGVAGASGIQSLSGIPFSADTVETNSVPDGAMFMLGHVTLTATDKDGNVIAYRQTDNYIGNQGENCVAEELWAIDESDNATSSCGGSVGTAGVTADGFNFIAIGTGTQAALDQSDNTLETETDRTSTAVTPTFSSSDGDTPTDTDGTRSFAKIVVSDTFTPSAGTYTESAIFDASSGGNLFARQEFSGIALSGSDDLTVEWTITIGSSSTA